MSHSIYTNRGSNVDPDDARDLCLPDEFNQIRPGFSVGYWVVLSRAHPDKGGRAHWNCKCKCGNVRRVGQYQLDSRSSLSCGCLLSEQMREMAGESFTIGCSIKVICGWCKKMMGLKTCVQSQHGTTSHSICEECKEKHFK